MDQLFYKRIAVLFLICFYSLTIASAQTDSSDVNADLEISLEDLMNIPITTATKTLTKADEAPAVTDVITSDQIKQRGYQNLAQLLNDITNNHEDRSNWGIGEPLNQNVGFGFRFDTGQNILFLYNGQRLNAFLPGNRFGGEEYLLSNIDRIEIIKGPGSALYGANAFTAVVNIISKTLEPGDKGEFNVGAQYIPTSKGYVISGSTLAPIGKGNISGAWRYASEQGQSLKIENSLFGNQTVKDGVNHAVDGELNYQRNNFGLFTKFTNQQRNTVTGFNGVNPSNMKELTLSTYAYSVGARQTIKTSSRSNIKISAGWHQDNWTEVALIPSFKVDSTGTKLMTDANGNPILDTLNIYRDGDSIRTSFFIDGQGADTRSIDGEIQFTLNYRKNNNIIAGVYASDDKVLHAERPTELNLVPFAFVPFRTISDPANNWLFDANASRQNIGLYLQSDFNITKNLILNAGYRLDLYSGAGALNVQRYSVSNPRAGLVYLNKTIGTMKVLYGEATRIPNGFETLSSVAILGNPNNKPEKIQIVQASWIKHWTRNFRTEFGGFTAVISHRLETNAAISDSLLALGYIGQFVNLDAKQSNHGVDGKIVYRLNKADLLLNFTQYFGSNDGRGNPIAYIPNTMINANINIPISWFNVNVGMNYRGSYTKAAGDPRAAVKGYFLGNLNLVAAPAKIPFEFSVSCRNVLNTKYNYPSSSLYFVNHFPARRAEIMIGVKYKFS